MSRLSNTRTEEKTLIILGNEKSGKSTIFNLALQKKDPQAYSQTCGINYNYIKFQPSKTKRFLLNVYEIGGDIENIQMVKSIVKDRVDSVVFVICLDLSKPELLLPLFKAYTKDLARVLKESCSQESLIDMINTKKGSYTEEKGLSLFPSEVILIGTKYDLFEKIDM